MIPDLTRRFPDSPTTCPTPTLRTTSGHPRGNSQNPAVLLAKSRTLTFIHNHMKRAFCFLFAALASMSMSSCTTTTTNDVQDEPAVVDTPVVVVKPPPGPPDFKVVNQYDDQKQ
jgi:hypothetical protein